MKPCTRCRAVKSRTEFYVKRQYRSGLTSWCKDCIRAYTSTPEERARCRTYYHRVGKHRRQTPSAQQRQRDYRRQYENRPEVKERRRRLRHAPARQAHKREYTRRYRQRDHVKAKRRAHLRAEQRGAAYQRRWKERNMDRVRTNRRAYENRRYAELKTNERLRRRKDAQSIIAIMRRNGWITPQPCAKCRATEVEAHHVSYDRPLDVTWLCRLHHNLVHHPLPVASGQGAKAPQPEALARS